MNYTGPKVRRSRRLGVALTPKAARVMEKRPNPPGQHGPAKAIRQRISDYGKQLLEKQRLRAQYNIHERQMRNYVARAVRRKGNTGDVLLQILESRLDAFVLRAGLARTIYAARQYVTHGHFMVNDKPINLPAYEIKVGDRVAVRPKSQRLPCFAEALEAAHPPSYITLDKDNLSAQLLRLPERSEVPIICDIPRVIEYYSR